MLTIFLTCCRESSPIKAIGEYDYKIAVAICITIVIVAFFILFGLLVWKWSDDGLKRHQRILARSEEMNNSDRRMKMDLLDRKLEVLKELSIEYVEDTPTRKYKVYESEEVKQYISAIDTAIKEISNSEKK